MSSLFSRFRRKSAPAAAAIDPLLWERTVSAIECLHGLDAARMAELHRLAGAFLAEKEMYGARDLVLTDAMQLTIAVQAVLPVLALGLQVYAGFVGIVVYPGEFRVRREELDEDGVLHQWSDDLTGEAWSGGPVVLSWQDVAAAEPGYNVVIHEFAHKLDMLSGDADGYPPAPPGIAAGRWREQLEAAYGAFCDDVAAAERAAPRHAETFEFPFDPYAAESPAEFFAVMSEAFFTDPHTLRGIYPALYDALGKFYRQDPAARLGPQR